jgi:hypothetical protein
MTQDNTQAAWDRIAAAKLAMHTAMHEYANALYDHNVNDRGITPLGSYHDAADTLNAASGNILDHVRYELQMRVTE